mmetsp:Transcript_84585/g.262709  ORF Transcript_84585/g.262709 Transcript_84585/m.262709 type:complete len:231 (+) Transcript_84585:337-1029(+)
MHLDLLQVGGRVLRVVESTKCLHMVLREGRGRVVRGKGVQRAQGKALVRTEPSAIDVVPSAEVLLSLDGKPVHADVGRAATVRDHAMHKLHLADIDGQPLRVLGESGEEGVIRLDQRQREGLPHVLGQQRHGLRVEVEVGKARDVPEVRRAYVQQHGLPAARGHEVCSPARSGEEVQQVVGPLALGAAGPRTVARGKVRCEVPPPSAQAQALRRQRQRHPGHQSRRPQSA